MLSYASEVHLVSEKLDVSDHLAGLLASSTVVRHEPDGIAKIVGRDGDQAVGAVELASGGSIDVEGVFIELGAKGVLDLTVGLGVELDPESLKYVVVDRGQKTNVDGVFAAGDVTGPPLQVAKAVGEGCVAGLSAAQYAKGVE
jgi:thioredoxin reductase (NADPH)